MSLQGATKTIGMFAKANKAQYNADNTKDVPVNFKNIIEHAIDNKEQFLIKALEVETTEFCKNSFCDENLSKRFIKSFLSNSEWRGSYSYISPSAKDFVSKYQKLKDGVYAANSVVHVLGNPDLLLELSGVINAEYSTVFKFALANPVLAINEFFPIESVYKEIIAQDSRHDHQMKEGEKLTVSKDENSGWKNVVAGWFSSGWFGKVESQETKQGAVETQKNQDSNGIQEDEGDRLSSYSADDVDKHFQTQVDIVTGHAKHFCYNYAKLNTIILDFCDYNFQMETPLDDQIAEISLHDFAPMTQGLVQDAQGAGNLIGDGSTLLLGEVPHDDNAQRLITNNGGEC